MLCGYEGLYMPVNRFDPNVATRYRAGIFGGSEMAVSAVDYDALLALYNDERQARKDDAREFQRELRDAYAEGDYNARNEPGTY